MELFNPKIKFLMFKPKIKFLMFQEMERFKETSCISCLNFPSSKNIKTPP